MGYTKEGNVLVNDALITFYLRLYGVRHMVTDSILWGDGGQTNNTISASRVVIGRKEMFYLTTHSTHFIYGYMASNIW